MINLSNFISPVPGFSNSNWTMYRLSGNGTSNHYFIAGRSGNIVASGKRKHCRGVEQRGYGYPCPHERKRVRYGEGRDGG